MIQKMIFYFRKWKDYYGCASFVSLPGATMSNSSDLFVKNILLSLMILCSSDGRVDGMGE